MTLEMIRQAWRAATARPLHAILVAGSIAIGIAANASVFAIVDAAIVRPFPFPSPERLIGSPARPAGRAALVATAA